MLQTILTIFGSTYALWLFYLAVMSLSRAKKQNQLPTLATILGIPILIIGYILDIFVNVTLLTFLLLEIPQELTVTERLQRHHKESTGWRLKVVEFFEPLLDPFDPDGDHV